MRLQSRDPGCCGLTSQKLQLISRYVKIDILSLFLGTLAQQICIFGAIYYFFLQNDRTERKQLGMFGSLSPAVFISNTGHTSARNFSQLLTPLSIIYITFLAYAAKLKYRYFRKHKMTLLLHSKCYISRRQGDTQQPHPQWIDRVRKEYLLFVTKVIAFLISIH